MILVIKSTAQKLFTTSNKNNQNSSCNSSMTTILNGKFFKKEKSFLLDQSTISTVKGEFNLNLYEDLKNFRLKIKESLKD